MTNTKLLEETIAKSGYKKGFIAEQLGVSRAGLSNLIHNKAEFKASQINTLSELLSLTDDRRNAIFFASAGV